LYVASLYGGAIRQAAVGERKIDTHPPDLKIAHAKARRREGFSLLIVPQWGMDTVLRNVGDKRAVGQCYNWLLRRHALRCFSTAGPVQRAIH
jgi:hypothetical protein